MLAAWLERVERFSWYGMLSCLPNPAALKIDCALLTQSWYQGLSGARIASLRFDCWNCADPAYFACLPSICLTAISAEASLTCVQSVATLHAYGARCANHLPDK